MEKIFLDNPWVVVLILLWTLPWKAVALWRSARRGHVGWFGALIILNTLAILDIIYIFFFSGPLAPKKKEETRQDVRQPRKPVRPRVKIEDAAQPQAQTSENSRRRAAIV